MDNIKLTVLSPESTLLDLMVGRVEFPGTMGRFVVLHDHAPLISSLGKGVISYSSDGVSDEIPISSGFVRIRDNVVTACVEI